MNIPKYEVGAKICQCGTGYELGAMASGTRNNVTVRGRCRPGCKTIGVVHTHPGGPVHLSNQDKRSLVDAKLPVGCVTDGITMRCFDVRRK